MATDHAAPEAAPLDVGAYCRQVEAYLCRRNGGHLIRLVGPAFQLVVGWAEEGVPLRIVEHGIDRTVTRLEAKGPRRRPVRLEFCEADVRDAFDQWHKAIGAHARRRAAPAEDADAATADPPRARRGPSLPAHVDRVVQRLSSLRAGTALSVPVGTAVDAALGELATVSTRARGARGEERAALQDELRRVDAALLRDVIGAAEPTQRERWKARAEGELQPMRDRLTSAVYHEARDRLVRQFARLDLSLPEIALP